MLHTVGAVDSLPASPRTEGWNLRKVAQAGDLGVEKRPLQRPLSTVNMSHFESLDDTNTEHPIEGEAFKKTGANIRNNENS